MSGSTINRVCVNCGQPLPPASKLTRTEINAREAAEKGWEGRPATDGRITVDMCVQCQIDRAKLRL